MKQYDSDKIAKSSKIKAEENENLTLANASPQRSTTIRKTTTAIKQRYTEPYQAIK
jgi:hypothetical protein